MSIQRRNVIVTLVLVLGLSAAAALLFWTANQPSSTPNPSQTRSPSPASSIRPSGQPSASNPPGPAAPTAGGPTIAPTVRPPSRSLHIGGQYLTANQAKRSTWDDVINAGRAIPQVNDRCTRAWRSSGKDSKIDWGTATYRCLDRLPGTAFKPQGVAGTGTAEGYTIGKSAASERNIIITSWYSKAAESGLLAPNRVGETVTRLVVMDLDRGRYNTVELVKADGPHRFRNLNSHGSGLVWAGQYLYSSSRTALWMYNADDILLIKGKFVLPAVSGWSVEGNGGLSSISIDRSSTPSQLTAIKYSKDKKAYIQKFALEANGLLAADSGESRRSLNLRNIFGQGGRVVRSADSDVLVGSSFQGVATIGDYALANSSALRFDGGGPVDATVVLEDGDVMEHYQMPLGNVESIYLDHRRSTYTTVTENRSQFLFTLPLRELIGR